MVSLKKEQPVREYTPEHLMDEEEAVRRFCPPRESNENPIVTTVVTTDDDADNLPIEKSDSKPKQSSNLRKILMLMVRGYCLLVCIISMIVGFVHGAEALSTDGFGLSVIAEMFPFVFISASASLVPTLMRVLLDYRRW